MDYDIYEYLRDLKEVRDSDVAKATGISPTVFSEWKKGKSSPKMDKAMKIANYFGVDVGVLMGQPETPIEVVEERYASEIKRQNAIDTAQEIFENEELSLLFKAAKNCKAEDLKLATEMLLALKRKEKHA